MSTWSRLLVSSVLGIGGVLVLSAALAEEKTLSFSDFTLEDELCERTELKFSGVQSKAAVVGVKDAKASPLLQSNVGKSPCRFPNKKDISELKCVISVGDAVTNLTFTLQHVDASTGDGFLTFVGSSPATLTTFNLYVWFRAGMYLLEQTSVMPSRRLLVRRSCSGDLAFPK